MDENYVKKTGVRQQTEDNIDEIYIIEGVWWLIEILRMVKKFIIIMQNVNC